MNNDMILSHGDQILPHSLRLGFLVKYEHKFFLEIDIFINHFIQ